MHRIPESPTHNVSRVDHALASLRESSLTLAIMSHVSALAIVASKSFASRRLRLSHAMVRSTTQRRGKTLPHRGSSVPPEMKLRLGRPSVSQPPPVKVRSEEHTSEL